MKKMLKFIVLFAVIIPMLLTSCEHAVKYKELPPLSQNVFLTTEDAYRISLPSSANRYPFLGEESEVFCADAELTHTEKLIPRGSKIEISKIYAILQPIYGGPIPSCSMMRTLYFRIMDVKSQKFFWLSSAYNEISTDESNQTRSVQVDSLKSPVTGEAAIMSVPFNIWNEQDMEEYNPSSDRK